jgi:hypothetical protein
LLDCTLFYYFEWDNLTGVLLEPFAVSRISLQNAARQALYLVRSRVEKCVGKTVVDTAAEPLPA